MRRLTRPWMLPLVPLYAAGAALRLVGLNPRRLAWPVISVGNLSSGGTGKTPLTIALAQLLTLEGFFVDVLSRGYGRQGNAVERVDGTGSAEQFGDEPLLIARQAGVPVYVGSERWLAGRLAELDSGLETGVHLLDDGFQHRQLARLADIVLVNSEDLGDSLLPAGNLREGVSALKRASVLAVPEGDDAATVRLRELGLGSENGQPVWRFRREMRVQEVSGAVVAFCGIARPGQFFAGLEHVGIAIAARYAFPDHHQFRAGDLRMLIRMVQNTGARALMTTTKDRVRLEAMASELEQDVPLLAAELNVILEDEAAVTAWLKNRLADF